MFGAEAEVSLLLNFRSQEILLYANTGILQTDQELSLHGSILIYTMISTTVLYYNILGYILKLSLSLMKLPNLQNEGRKVSESFMKFHELKLSILEVSEP